MPSSQPPATHILAAQTPALQAIQVTSHAAQLSDLPMDMLGLICRPLNLRDRASLSITCRSFLHGLANSEDVWGALEFFVRAPAIFTWLAYRRQGLRRLTLDFCTVPEGEEEQTAAQLAACLEGSPLVQLTLDGNVSAGQGGSALHWLGSCTALTSLTLTDCELSCLPGTLGLLSSLVELSLAGNNLGGASWEQLRQLTALTRLDIYRCGLTAMPVELAALPTMAGLRLAGNNLREASWEQLRQLATIAWLDVSNCELASLPAELAALTSLAALNLYGNRDLSAAEADAWAPLAQCSGLNSLCLGGMMFARLPPALAALAPHLVDLNLQDTAHRSLWAGGEATLGPLRRLSCLTRLNLHSCLKDLPLPQQLCWLVALQDLDLSLNALTGEGLKLWPLRNLTRLTRLNLSSSKLKCVPEEVSCLQALRDLDLGYNERIGSTSWHHLAKLKALTRLSLGCCQLEWLPPELAELPSLAALSLHENRLLGTCIGESALSVTAKWAPLEELTALIYLDASSCGLYAVPAALATLPHLRVLRLGYNPLGSGGVQALRALVFITAVQRLDLSGCGLPWELAVDAIPFPLHRLEGWAEPAKDPLLESWEEDAEAEWGTDSLAAYEQDAEPPY